MWFGNTPLIGDLRPGGRFTAKDVHDAGGTAVIIGALIRSGHIHGECLTVTGRTMAEDYASAEPPDGQVVREPATPIAPSFHWVPDARLPCWVPKKLRPLPAHSTNAVSLSQQLSSGVLISYEGEGHTIYAQGVACVDDAVDAYLLDGTVHIAGQTFEPGRMLIFRPGDSLTVEATTQARLLLIGGEPMDGPRHLWWNFVSSRRERIEQAKADWAAGRILLPPNDNAEFVPLPADKSRPSGAGPAGGGGAPAPQALS